MKLSMLKRAKNKSETKKLRREGNIPAVVYIRDKESETITVPAAEFSAILRNLQPGRLSTVIFSLTDENGKARRAIIKEIQYEPTSYAVQHLDFEELIEDRKINIKVPIECTGVVDCVGVKLGGILRQVIRHVRVNCLPKDIPEVFFIDVKSLGLNEKKKLSDLEIPQTVRPVGNLKEVAVLVAKR